jgi:hypothetical protein
MKVSSRLIAALTVLTFSTSALAQTETQQPPLEPVPQHEEAEGKLVWGVLIKLIAPSVFQIFANWVIKKIEPTYDTKALSKLSMNLANASIVKLGDMFVQRDVILAGVAPATEMGEPQQPLTTDANGENYQGVHVALVEVDAEGKPLRFRTVAHGFQTGERFKLRVLSTFDGLVVLGNVTPKGVHRQIYPATNERAVSIPAGKEILLPLGKKEYLQFVGDVGRDQISITVRDPRSMEPGSASTAQVNRKDEPYGSNFLQEVKPGKYPVISEYISIQHR